jgi:hypothetical protein
VGSPFRSGEGATTGWPSGARAFPFCHLRKIPRVGEAGVSGCRFPPTSGRYFQRMLICSVLRCTNPGSAFVAGTGNVTASSPEAYVCPEHKKRMDAGAPWDMQERHVLIGHDLAPVLANWSARPSTGSEGFVLRLELMGEIKPVEVFLMPSEARTLSTFLQAFNNRGGALACSEYSLENCHRRMMLAPSFQAKGSTVVPLLGGGTSSTEPPTTPPLF